MKAVNLIPADQRRGAGGTAGRAGGVVYVIVGGLVGLVLMSVLFAISSSQVNDRQSKLANVTTQANVVQSQATTLQPYVSFQTIRQTRQQAIAGIAGSRFDWSGAMDQIARSLPNDVTLSAVTGTPATNTPPAAVAPAPTTSTSSTPAATPAAPAATGPSVALSGCASTHSEVASVLVDLQRIVGVTSVSLGSSQKGTGAGAGSGNTGCPGATFTATVAYGPQTVQSTDSTTNGVTAATATSPTAGSTR
jgi:Tfp pilus assembly protein PilN